MICWGDRKNCGIFVPDAEDRKNCNCERELCISDLPIDDRKPCLAGDLEEVQDTVYVRSDEFINELNNMIQIKSISGEKTFDKQNKQIIDRLAQYLKELKFEVEVVEVKPKTEKENMTTQYVIFANYFSTPLKNVVLIYGYVDVLPVDEPSKWKFDPFQLTEENGMLYGHGVATSKGPILAWIQAIDAWYALTEDLPINVRFVIEVSHYQNSRGLKQLLDKRKKFFQPVDLIIYCTNHWITDKTPMIGSSHSGYVYFELNVHAKETASKNYTPFPSDPMAEMCRLMSTLTEPKSGILVNDFLRHVEPLTQNDWNIMCKMESGPMEFKDMHDIKQLPHEESRPDYLKHRWCMPSISIHNVKTFHSDSLRNLRTPNHCVTQFSVKLVYQQSVKYMIYLIQSHFHKAYRELKCVHNAELRVIDKLAPLTESRNSPFRDAVKNSFSRVYNCEAVVPDNISITLPMLNELRKYCPPRAFSVGVPFASIHTLPNMVNECQSREMYIENVNLCLSIMFEVSELPPGCKCSMIPDFCFTRGNETELDLMTLIAHHHPSITYDVHELDAWEQKQKMFTVESNKEQQNANDVVFGNKRANKLD